MSATCGRSSGATPIAIVARPMVLAGWIVHHLLASDTYIIEAVVDVFLSQVSDAGPHRHTLVLSSITLHEQEVTLESEPVDEPIC